MRIDQTDAVGLYEVNLKKTDYGPWTRQLRFGIGVLDQTTRVLYMGLDQTTRVLRIASSCWISGLHQQQFLEEREPSVMMPSNKMLKKNNKIVWNVFVSKQFYLSGITEHYAMFLERHGSLSEHNSSIARHFSIIRQDLRRQSIGGSGTNSGRRLHLFTFVTRKYTQYNTNITTNIARPILNNSRIQIGSLWPEFLGLPSNMFAYM